MELRKYQIEAINKVRQEFLKGNKRVCLCLPCGAGKTCCFAYMAERHKGQVLFLVHRRELIDQTIKAFPNGVPNNVYIGMIGTAIKLAPPNPTLIVIDECHHATASTYRNVILQYPNAYVIGLTATPARLDGTGLGAIFDSLVVGVEPQWLIDNKYLSEYKYYAPPSNVMLPKIKFGDFDTSTMEYENRIYGDIIKYIEPNDKVIIYCPNIVYSKTVANKVGGVHFDGDTPKKERDEIIDKFRKGEIKILCNVDLIGEGFDVPDCNKVILLRPTMSLTLFIQQSMRCLRYKTGKVATIIDMVGNVFRHGLPTEHREWTLLGKIKVANRDGEPDVLVRQCKNCFRVYEGKSRVCPYCKFEQPKTQREIKEEQEAELVEIKKIERREVGMARTLEQLQEIAKKRGYSKGWAYYVYKSRGRI